MIDAGDAAYGDFLIWRDSNQDGVSQKHELASLARHGIASISLTRSDVVQASADASANAVLATSVFIRRDGSVSELADAMLGYQSDVPAPDLSGGRTADDRTKITDGRGGGGGGGGTGGAHSDNENETEELEPRDRRRRRRGRESSGPSRRERDERQASATFVAGDSEEPRIVALGAQAGALHAGLGVVDRKLLGMIDAMAQFEASSSADLGSNRRKLSPRVAELLTSLPDIR